MNAQLAASKTDGFVETLRNLLRLVSISGPEGTKKIVGSALITSVAAMADAASLGLLREMMDDISDAGAKAASLQIPLAFLCAALVGTVLRMIANRQTLGAQYWINRALALKAFATLQNQQYADYLRRGASEGFATFDRLQLVSNFGIVPLIAGIAAAFSAAVMLLATLVFYPAAGGFLLLALALIALETIWRSHTVPPGMLSGLSRGRSMLLYEARTAFRDIFLTNSQERMCSDFAQAESSYRLEQNRLQLAGQNSRYTIEIFGIMMAIIILLVLFYVPPSGIAIIPLLAILAFATFRLLPQIATLRSSYRMISLHADVSADVRELLEQSTTLPISTKSDPVTLKHTLSLRNIAFSREDRPQIFENLNLEIEKGTRIGISGASGIGKSTLLDIVCGAIAPDKGTVLIDDIELNVARGQAWRERLGVVSQNPVLLGETLRDAIVYPQHPENADMARFDAAVADASIMEMVAAFPKGLETPVGEAVASLSGGQRQRLALAHALYRARDLLLLDEATGQLDDGSERAIIAAIKALPRDLTIIVSSHRPEIFESCDVVYYLDRGGLKPMPVNPR